MTVDEANKIVVNGYPYHNYQDVTDIRDAIEVSCYAAGWVKYDLLTHDKLNDHCKDLIKLGYKVDA